MNLPLFFARRYLFSKKSSNAINIISWISVVSIAIASFALVVVLSAFNGLQELVESMYKDFEPDVKVSLAQGKWFEADKLDIESWKEWEGVESVYPMLEEMTLIRYGKQQTPCVMKGIEPAFLLSTKLDQHILRGQALLEMNHQPTAIVGYGIANALSLYIDNAIEPIKIYAPKVSTQPILDPSEAFYTKSITPAAIYFINPDIDNKFMLVPMKTAQKFLRREKEITGVELKVMDGWEETIKQKLIAELDGGYKVKTRFELNELVYQTNQSEKVVTFFILTFILVIAAFNVISTLTMILLEKKKDISTLRVLGFSASDIRRIFATEGLLINFFGVFIGMLFGTALCLGQIYFGIVPLEGGIVDFYPVKLLASDFVLILITVFVIGLIASYFPARMLIRSESQATLREVY